MCKKKRGRPPKEQKPSEIAYQGLQQLKRYISAPFPTMADRSNTFDQQGQRVLSNERLYLKKRGKLYVESYRFLNFFRGSPFYQYLDKGMGTLYGNIDSHFGLNFYHKILERFGLTAETVIIQNSPFGSITAEKLFDTLKAGLSEVYKIDSVVGTRPVNNYRTGFGFKAKRGAPSHMGKILDNLLIYGGARTPQQGALKLAICLTVGGAWYWYNNPTALQTLISPQQPNFEDNDDPERIVEDLTKRQFDPKGTTLPGDDPDSPSDGNTQVRPTGGALSRYFPMPQRPSWAGSGDLSVFHPTLSMEQATRTSTIMGLSSYNPALLSSWSLPVEIFFRALYASMVEVTCQRCHTEYVWNWETVQAMTFMVPFEERLALSCPTCMRTDPIRTMVDPPSCTIRPLSVAGIRSFLLRQA